MRTMRSDLKTCPQCRAEFEYWASECYDCQVELVPAAELRDSAAAGGGGMGEGPREGDLLLREGLPLAWCYTLVDALQARGIRAAIGAPEGDGCGTGGCAGPRLGVFVDPGRFSDAQVVDEEVLREQVPDVADWGSTEVGGSCPACGARLPAKPQECPDCGLNLGTTDLDESLGWE